MDDAAKYVPVATRRARVATLKRTQLIQAPLRSPRSSTTSCGLPPRVMAGLVPATHVFVSTEKVVGARAKPDTERSRRRSKQRWYVPAGLLLTPMGTSQAMTGGKRSDAICAPKQLCPGGP